jgi:hypothetical protein
MDLTLFPMDTQVCNLIFESYSYNTAEVEIYWQEIDPLVIVGSMRLPDYLLIAHNTSQSRSDYTAGNWDQLYSRFVFKRQRGYYILQVGHQPLVVTNRVQ